jgi:hypothetical protein
MFDFLEAGAQKPYFETHPKEFMIERNLRNNAIIYRPIEGTEAENIYKGISEILVDENGKVIEVEQPRWLDSDVGVINIYDETGEVIFQRTR